MTDLRLILYFEVVYRLLSFSRAAEELHLTHSAVTRAIKSLEDAWGTQLFYRTTRSVVPTEAGERLYPMAVELLAFAETVHHETVSGDRELKLVGGPIAFDILLPTAILAFSEALPEVRMRADVMPPHAAIEELVQRRVHVVLFNMSTLQAMPHAGRLQFQEIMTDDFIMACRPGHPALDAADDLARLLEFPWAFPGYLHYLDGQLPPGLTKMMERAGAPHYTLYSPTACMNLSMISDVMTIVPLSLATAHLQAGHVVGRRVPGVPKYHLGAAFRREADLEPNIRHFLDCLSTAAREMERSNAERMKSFN